jgi:hypothetical protein
VRIGSRCSRSFATWSSDVVWRRGKLLYLSLWWQQRGVTYLGLGFVYLCGELRVGWSALDPYQFCGLVTRVPSSQHICAMRALISSLGRGQGTHTCRCGFDLGPQSLVTLRERFCLFYESGDLVIGERIEIALVRDEECVLA